MGYIRVMVSVFDYLDYRRYLADYYQFKKSVNKHFSYRLIADKAGIPSTGFFSEILSGRRNLTRSKIPKMAKALSLSEKEQAYLSILVDFNHAKTEKAKQSLYASLVQAMPLHVQRLKSSQWEYFSKWYHIAVREALAIHQVKENFDELGSLLRPAITATQAKASIRLLDGLGLIAKDKAGYWRATHISLLSQKDESSALMVRSFQGEMIGLAQSALESIPREERDISCVTMSVSGPGLDRIKDVLKETHKRILEIVQADSAEDRVVQMNIQVFPITRSKVKVDHAPVQN
jgi:uncharacterized protein (TIGR02147 family)